MFFYLAQWEKIGVSNTSHVSCSSISHFAGGNELKKIEKMERICWHLPGMFRMLISPNTTPSPRVTNTWEYKYNNNFFLWRGERNSEYKWMQVLNFRIRIFLIWKSVSEATLTPSSATTSSFPLLIIYISFPTSPFLQLCIFAFCIFPLFPTFPALVFHHDIYNLDHICNTDISYYNTKHSLFSNSFLISVCSRVAGVARMALAEMLVKALFERPSRGCCSCFAFLVCTIPDTVVLFVVPLTTESFPVLYKL